ncbi:PREDICTED: polymeric immunoglobulin receptor [Buceros rhinoceros silvestris]|uniref:polymeric immunoglobulin receptor n=1 Tax=Buceros rhinoceros silvestris TaxID=175836 RepID=UPI00052833B5|nr:PREDICTED: polymeric immunoglobulin receptor [Buceros rhinoceros silvestris]
MTLLVFIFLLAFLADESASTRNLPKSASNPVFGPRQVYGLVNGSVTVKCFYPPTSVNRHDRKYWCRESAMGCTTIVSTSGYTAPSFRGRASITDYPEAENFQITMSKLTEANAGSYQCGIGINGRGLSYRVSLDVSEGPHIPEGAELFYVLLHSSVTMSCSFGEDAANKRKFLCKMAKNGCNNVIDSYGNVSEDFTGRVLLSFKDSPGSFSVIITQMGWEDSGLYVCGAGVYGETGETQELDVHVYEKSNVPQTKPTIIGVKGTSATFECRYKSPKSSSVKYLCKWRENSCSRIIDSSGFVRPKYEGRVALYDNLVNNTFTIILNQLTDSDKGYYWCMTEEIREQQSSIELKIIDGEPGLKGKEEVEAQVGSRLDLTCSYSCKYYSYQKYWCRWNSTSFNPLPVSDQRQLGPDVSCDTDNRTVILSFDSVAKTDQGWYWCGVQHNGLFGETLPVYLTVTGGRSSNRNLELLNTEPPVPAEPPVHAEGGFIPQGRAYSDAGVQSAAGSESSDGGHGHSALTVSLTIAAAVVVVLVTAFAVFKYRQMKRSDLVSIGSYRTNISMSDFESMKGYSANNNACVKESEETQIGGDEFISTAAMPENAAETKKAKRSSKEDADLAYSTFLLTSGSITQGSSRGDSAVPDVPTATREGQI